MKKKHFLHLFIAVFLFYSCNKSKKVEKETTLTLSNYTDPFIGTAGHGHTYPGATMPFGMLQVSPDNGISKWDWCSGYHYTNSITIGFSHLHLSGTGIGGLNDIRFMPINRKVDLTKPVKTRGDMPFKSSYSHDDEVAQAGYYSVYLKDHDIKAELTSNLRTAYHQYTYKKNDLQSVIIDLGFALNWDKTLQTHIKVEDKFTISGYRYSNGWATNQKVFFVAKFSKPIKVYNLIAEDQYIKENNVSGVQTSAQLFFNDLSKDKIQVKVSLSSVSIKNAFENLKSDNNHFDFDKIKIKAQKEWNHELSKIVVETSNDTHKAIFIQPCTMCKLHQLLIVM